MKNINFINTTSLAIGQEGGGGGRGRKARRRREGRRERVTRDDNEKDAVGGEMREIGVGGSKKKKGRRIGTWKGKDVMDGCCVYKGEK